MARFLATSMPILTIETPFAPWKIAISGLYKKLEFRLIGKINNQPVVFDDTVYFLSFNEFKAADETFQLLNSPAAHKFYTSLIFWDEKRPIKSSILNCLNLTKLAEESAITTETQFLG